MGAAGTEVAVSAHSHALIPWDAVTGVRPLIGVGSRALQDASRP
jgi:hypothetical protein